MSLELNTYNRTQALRSLLEALDEVRASTRDDHAEAIRQVRLAFEARIAQAVAYRVTQVLDAITGE